MGLVMGGDGLLQLFGVVLAEGDEEDDVGVGGAAIFSLRFSPAAER